MVYRSLLLGSEVLRSWPSWLHTVRSDVEHNLGWELRCSTVGYDLKDFDQVMTLGIEKDDQPELKLIAVSVVWKSYLQYVDSFNSPFKMQEAPCPYLCRFQMATPNSAIGFNCLGFRLWTSLCPQCDLRSWDWRWYGSVCMVYKHQRVGTCHSSRHAI